MFADMAVALERASRYGVRGLGRGTQAEGPRSTQRSPPRRDRFRRVPESTLVVITL